MSSQARAVPEGVLQGERTPLPPLEYPDPLEQSLGLSHFLTQGSPGTGGRLRSEPEDFVVVEHPLPWTPSVGEGKYTVALIRSRNWETNRLVREISRALRISRGGIFFSGTKDKRAVTTQYMSIRAPREKVLALKLRDVEILEAFRTDRAPKIGELRGNSFEIVVRHFALGVEEVPSRVGPILSEIQRRGGFPNYFGLQRFGQIRPVTQEVGKRIVLGDLEGAVLAYVGNPMRGEPPKEREARRRVEETRDYAQALREFPSHMTFERSILSHLARRPGDFEGALLTLPRNLLTMFVYAYQSLLFNRIVSRRMERGVGLSTVEVGDIVLPLDEEGVPIEGRLVEVDSSNLSLVRREVESGKAAVSGLVVGSEPHVAGGIQGEVEKEVVDEEGIDPKAFSCPALPEAASKGLRRALHVRPTQLEWGIRKDERGDGLSVRFFLPKGSYATVFLREIMKSPSEAY